MTHPPSRFPTLKAQHVMRLLRSIGYQEVRRRGSHRTLKAAGRRTIHFAWHDGRDVRPRYLRDMLVEDAGLSDEEIASLLGW